MTAEPIDWAALSARGGLTVDDLPEEHSVGVRMELIDGSLIVTPLGDVEHQKLAGRVYALLISQSLPPGCIALPGVNVMVGNRTLVIPDVAVVDPDHADSGLGIRPDGLRLAVEITSPSTRIHDLTTKREIYAGWSVPYVVVDRSSSPPTPRIHGELPSWGRVVLDALR